MQPKFNNLLIIGWIYEVKAIHRCTGILCQGDSEPLPKNSYKFPKFLLYSRKETRIIQCTHNSVHMKWKYSYIDMNLSHELKKHFKT